MEPLNRDVNVNQPKQVTSRINNAEFSFYDSSRSYSPPLFPAASKCLASGVNFILLEAPNFNSDVSGRMAIEHCDPKRSKSTYRCSTVIKQGRTTAIKHPVYAYGIVFGVSTITVDERSS
jgi:hypothetical protein